MAYRFRIFLLAVMLGCGLTVVTPPVSSFSAWVMAGLGVLDIILMIVSNSRWSVVLLIGLGVASGVFWTSWRAGGSARPNPPSTILSITGRVDQVTAVSNGQHRFGLNVVASGAEHTPSTVQVITSHAPLPLGTLARARCIWKKSTALGGDGWECFSRQIAVVGFQAPSLLTGWSEWVRQTIGRVVHESFTEPEGSLLLGMVFGMSEGIPWSIADDFRSTGTTHLLVVSGMQFVILVTLFERLLTQLRIPLVFRTVLIAFVLGILLLIVGASASTVRAAIMAILPLCSRVLGRGRASIHALVLASAGMVIVSPAIMGLLRNTHISSSKITPKMIKYE